MKNLFILCMTQILFFSSSFAQGSNGLVAHWNFNGTANDVSGNGLNGVITGTSHAQGYNGLDSTAYYFNGSSDRITVPYSSSLNVDFFSACALVNIKDFYSGPCQGNIIMARGHLESAGPNSNYSLKIFDNAYDNSCNIYTPTEERIISDAHGATPNSASLWLSSPSIDTNRWYCFVATYDGDSIKMYIDGILVNQQSWKNTLNNAYAPTTEDLGIGYYIEGGGAFPYFLNGRIDDMRLYNRALTSAEVSQYCDSAKRIPAPQPKDSVNRDTLGSGGVVFVQDLTLNGKFRISPTSNALTIQTSLNGYNIAIYNSIGQVVDKEENIGNGMHQINWTGYPAGIYIIQIRYKSQTITKRVLKR